MKVLILEEWCRQPRQTIRECYRFIGVDEAFVPRFEVCNSGDDQGPVYPVTWPARQYHRFIGGYVARLLESLGARMTARRLRYIPAVFGFYSRCPAPMEEALRRKLNCQFRPQIKAEEEALGRKIPAWHL